jgi:DNA-binding CsgD family transcriptional regulator
MSHESTVAAMAELLGASDEHGLAIKLQAATTVLGFDRLVLDVAISRPVVGRVHYTGAGCPLSWQKIQTREGLADAFAPMEQCAPEGWFGLSLPAHEKAGITSKITLARPAPLPTNEEEAKHLHNNACIFSACVHVVTVKTLVPALLEHNDPQLSPREKECVKWAAHGKTSEEIGIKLHISEPTVVFHINKVVRKLGVRNRMHAVALSVALGLVA